MKVNTHLAIDRNFVGEPVSVEEGKASARLITKTEMAADDRGLVHGGFTFGLADFAAMLAVNDPHVVLGAADVQFLAPVHAGDILMAHAKVLTEKGKKRQVNCEVLIGSNPVFKGAFTCFILDKHIFDM